MPCEHHKLCGDCFSPRVVVDLERRLATAQAELEAERQARIAAQAECAELRAQLQLEKDYGAAHAADVARSFGGS